METILKGVAADLLRASSKAPAMMDGAATAVKAHKAISTADQATAAAKVINKSTGGIAARTMYGTELRRNSMLTDSDL